VQNGEQGRWPSSPVHPFCGANALAKFIATAAATAALPPRKYREICIYCGATGRASGLRPKQTRAAHAASAGFVLQRAGGPAADPVTNHVFIIHAKSLSINPPAATAADAAHSLSLSLICSAAENFLRSLQETGFPRDACVSAAAAAAAATFLRETQKSCRTRDDRMQMRQFISNYCDGSQIMKTFVENRASVLN
jgi:hypothetical protein